MKHVAALILLSFTFCTLCSGKFKYDEAKISKNTARLVDSILVVNELMGQAVGEGGFRPLQFDNFTELRTNATQEELRELTGHPNAVVRCYAFWGLAYDSSVQLLPIILEHADDTAEVHTQFGCMGSMQMAGDFFIELATPNYIAGNINKLSPAEFVILDSILIYTPGIKLESMRLAIARAKPSEKFYSRLRQLVISETWNEHVVKLAAFRKEQDIPLLQKGLNGSSPFFTYKAISYFPHPVFLPQLQSGLRQYNNDGYVPNAVVQLYRAIASYRSDTAATILHAALDSLSGRKTRREHAEIIFAAASDFYTPAYDGIFWRIWSNEHIITRSVFQVLYPKNKAKALSLTRDMFVEEDVLYDAGCREDEEDTLNLVHVMIDTLWKYDRNFAKRTINKHLREDNVHTFRIIASRLSQLEDRSFAASLLSRLEQEDNPHVYLLATEILISYRDKAIDRRIVELSKQNPALRQGWGGKRFIQLLKKHGLE